VRAQLDSATSISREDLLIRADEAYQVLCSVLPRSWRFQSFMKLIIKDTAGHIGAAVAVVAYMRTKFTQSTSDVGIHLEYQLIQFFLSDAIIEALVRCFGNFMISPETQRLREILHNCIFYSEQVNVHCDYSDNDWDLIREMRRFGLLLDDDDGSAGRTKLALSSPIVQRYTLNRLHNSNQILRPVESYYPSSLRSLIEGALSTMTSASIRASTVPGKFPAEAAFQGHFLNRFIALTPRGCHTVPELNQVFSDKYEKIDGRIDLYINSHLCWGIELLIKGTRLMEHLLRFEKNGRLKVKDYVVIDIRPAPVTDIERHPKLATIFFAHTFESCVLLFGDDPKPVNISLLHT
jgi:hypothetical protein